MTDERRERWREIIFEAETPNGKLFDVILLWVIALSVLTVMLESVETIHLRYRTIFFIIEFLFTFLFAVEYLIRIIVVKHPLRYIFSFYGVVDLFSILPIFLAPYSAESSSLLVIRVIRLLRVFRVLKLMRFLDQAQKLRNALESSRAKIMVFLFSISVLVIILGTIMYMIESPEAGFTSIPQSIYWAVVTLTTVGYGDITPHTAIGQTLASVVMIIGYAIIAVPTGIVTSELVKSNMIANTLKCVNCEHKNHDEDARYCKYCGKRLSDLKEL